MSVYIPSQEQSSVINSNLSLANITYIHESTALHTLALRIREQLIKGKKSIIVVPDANQRAVLSDIFRAMELHLLVNSTDTQQELSPADINNIRSRIFKNQDNIPTSATIHPMAFDKASGDLCRYFDKRYKQAENGLTWRKWLDIFLRYPGSIWRSILHTELGSKSLTFAIEEFERIKSNVADGAYMYQPDFDLIETGLLSDQICQQPEIESRLQDITYAIFTFKEMALHLMNKYYRYHRMLEQVYIQEALSRLTSVKDSLAAFRYRYEAFCDHTGKSNESAGILGVFTSKTQNTEEQKKTLTKELNQIAANIRTARPGENFFFDHLPSDIQPILTSFESTIQRLEASIQTDFSDYIKSVNKFNRKDTELSDLEYELDALIMTINNSGIFAHTYEINTLSFKKQMDYILRIVADLDKTMRLIEKNMPYYQWVTFLENIEDTDRKIIKILTRTESDNWQSIVESWYMYEWLTKNFNHLSNTNDEIFTSIENLYAAKQSYENETLKSTLEQHLVSYYKTLKESHPELAVLLKNGVMPKHPVTWKNMVTSYGGLISRVYPVLVTCEDDFKDIKPGHYHHLYYFDHANANVEILQLFEQIYSFYQESNFPGTADITLTGHPFTATPDIMQVAVSERLPIVRTITDALLSTQATPQIFQMRQACIVSFSTPYVHEHLTALCYDQGIKNIQAGPSVYQTLLGALLDTKSHIYIVIEDGLLDPAHPENFLWQRYIIRILAQAGCEIISIATSALLLEDGPTLTEQLSIVVSDSHKDVFPPKKQLQIEFNG